MHPLSDRLPRHTVRRMACVGKQGFTHYRHAVRVRRRITKWARHRRRASLNIYRCPACKHWHLGGHD